MGRNGRPPEFELATGLVNYLTRGCATNSSCENMLKIKKTNVPA